MIEAYAFLAAFTVQIFALSIFYPVRLIRYVRGWATNFGSERFTRLYKEVDYSKFADQFATRFRLANSIIAVIGALLLGLLYQRSMNVDWEGEATKLTLLYFFLQMSPLIVLLFYGLLRYGTTILQPGPEAKRTATLRRRGIFDFVSPIVVVIAGLSYLLSVAFAIYVDLDVYGNTSVSKYCYGAIGSITFVYTLNAFVIYKSLYGRSNPLVTYDGRVHAMRKTVKGSVYSCIVTAWFVSLMGVLSQPAMRTWSPFALSIFLMTIVLLTFVDLNTSYKPHINELSDTQVS
jgi:hypothetical protein